MKKRMIAVCLVLFVALWSVNPVITSAKAIKKIVNGGYITEYKKAQIKGKKLIIKGKVENWVRSVDTPPYRKSGTFKLKLAKKLEIIDGYRETAHNISVARFNKLCRVHDRSHSCFGFVIKNNKAILIRFW